MITLKLTERQADAIRSWILYLDTGPTDFEEANPDAGRACREVLHKLRGASRAKIVPEVKP